MSSSNQDPASMTKEEQFQLNIAESFAELGTGLGYIPSKSMNFYKQQNAAKIQRDKANLRACSNKPATLLCGICCGGSCQC
jgi:hypothetical protein